MIDKTFHYSDPEMIVCNACEHCIYDMKKGLYCKENKVSIKAYWTCEKANSIRNKKTTIAMKTKRIINGAFWGAIGLAACIGTCIVWHKNGCQIESLIAAIAYYTGAPFAIGYTIDSCICGR